MADKRKKRKKPQPKAKKPPPRCKAILLCSKAIIEHGTGIVSVIGIVDRCTCDKLPNVLPQFTLFIQLIDGIGSYDIKVEIHDLKKGVVMGHGGILGLTWPEKLRKFNVVLPINAMPVSHTGHYDVVVLANGEEIDRQEFEVVLKGRDTQ